MLTTAWKKSTIITSHQYHSMTASRHFGCIPYQCYHHFSFDAIIFFMHPGCFASRLSQNCALRVHICTVVHKENNYVTVVSNLYKSRTVGMNTEICNRSKFYVSLKFWLIILWQFYFQESWPSTSQYKQTLPHTQEMDRPPKPCWPSLKWRQLAEVRILYFYHQWHFDCFS